MKYRHFSASLVGGGGGYSISTILHKGDALSNLRESKCTPSLIYTVNYLKNEKGNTLPVTVFLLSFESQAYANVMKGNMDGLKKRDKRSAKSKSKTTKAT